MSVEAPTLTQKISAEALGTFVLVFFGCGSVLMSDGNYVAVALTFGLTVLVMAYAVGRVSGGHFNPAVTIGAAVCGRLAWREVGFYVSAQLGGATAAGLVLFTLMHGFEGYNSVGNMGQNFFGDEGTGYAWWAAFLLEMLMTAIFLYVILAVTDRRNEHPALAPLAIGFSLAMIHFVGIAATGTSVNPARSMGPALFAGSDAILQLWLFILAPLLGGAIAGLTYAPLFGRDTDPVPGSGLNFGRGSRAAVPGYGAPDQFQQQWTQGDAAQQDYQGGQYAEPQQQQQQQYPQQEYPPAQQQQQYPQQQYPPAQQQYPQYPQQQYPPAEQQRSAPEQPGQEQWAQPAPEEPEQQQWQSPTRQWDQTSYTEGESSEDGHTQGRPHEDT